MKYRKATVHDTSVLAKLNHQLIRDEGHRNPMTVPELEERVRAWLNTDYEAVIFEDGADAFWKAVGFSEYCLTLESPGQYH